MSAPAAHDHIANGALATAIATSRASGVAGNATARAAYSQTIPIDLDASAVSAPARREIVLCHYLLRED